MASPVFVNNCIKRIRESTVGLDMREPLADGLEGIVNYYESEGIQIKGVMMGTSLTLLHDEDYRLNIQTA